jgi:hypothetical protein
VAQVVLIFEIVLDHTEDPKKAFHLSLKVRHRPVKNRKIERMSRINPILANWVPEEFPKLMVKAI